MEFNLIDIIPLKWRQIFLYAYEVLLNAAIFWLLGFFGFNFYIVVCLIVIISWSYVIKDKFKKYKIFGEKLSLNEKDVILNYAKNLPSWVYFPDVEKAEWLNKIVSKMWPFLCEHVKDRILSDIQPQINALLPNIAQPFRFVELTMGDLSPRIGGIKTYHGENISADAVVFDVELYLFSNSNIVVEINRTTWGVKEFQLRGTLRFECRPLLSEIPFIGAVSVSFINQPYINFDLTNFGNVLDIPFISEIVHSTIDEMVQNLIVVPNRIIIPLNETIDIKLLRQPLPQGVLKIHIIEAKDLLAKDSRFICSRAKSSDPYCIVKVAGQKFRTRSIKKTLAPKWDEYFNAVIDDRVGQNLEIEVWDKDKLNQDDTLGRASISISNVFLTGAVNVWLSLLDIKRGSIHLSLSWMNLESDFELENIDLPSTKKDPFIGYLQVIVDRASNLKFLNKVDEPNPQGILQLGKQKKILGVKKNTNNPIWGSCFHFFVQNFSLDVLKILLFHETPSQFLGECHISIHELLSKENKTMERPVQLKNTHQVDSFVYVRLILRLLNPKRLLDEDSGFSVDSKTDKTNSRKKSLTKSPSPGKLHLTLTYDKEENILSIHIIEAKNLPQLSSQEESDFYVRVKIFSMDASFTAGDFICKNTTTVNGCQELLFNEQTILPIDVEQLKETEITFIIYSKVDSLSDKQDYGYVKINLATEMSEIMTFTKWFPLTPSRGTCSSVSFDS